MKVLVTGGAGFIGSHVVDLLRSRGAEVICVDSLDPGVWQQPPSYLRADVRYVFRDLRHWTPCGELEGVEAVVHLAALGGVSRAGREPGNVLDANVAGTARLLDAVRGLPTLRHVVLASSFSVYGRNYTYRVPSTGRLLTGDRREADLQAGRFDVYDPDTGEVAEIVAITESATPDPLEYYGASKYMQELCFRGFDAAPLTIFRFSSVYGPRLRLDDGEATIIAKLAGWIRDGVTPTLFEDGRQIRDWVYVGDIAEAVVRVLEGAQAPGVVNVCSGVATTLHDACRILGEIFGTSIEPRVVGGFRPGDMRHCLGDPRTLTALLGRSPRAFREAAGLAFASQTS